MSVFWSLDDNIYLFFNSLTGRSPLLDVLFSLPNVSNLVKAGPVGAALFYAWFSGQGTDRVRRRSILLITLLSLVFTVAITKSVGQSIYFPRPFVRTVPLLELDAGKFVLEEPLPSREPLAGPNRERFEALKHGTVTANDLASFPSDHAAFFFPLALGIFLACRRAGAVALGWTVAVILTTRIMSGMHSPFDIIAGATIGTAVLVAFLFAGRRWLSRFFDAAADWTIRKDAFAASLLFIVTYAIVNVLEDLDAVARAVLPLLKSVRSVMGAFLALLLCGCSLENKGALVLIDPDWRADVVLTEKDGLASPDGLRWAGNRLLIADEGGHAVRAWRPGGKIETLADRQDGIGAPEDLDQDASGNVYFTDDKRGGVWRTDARGKTTHFINGIQGVGATEGIVLAPSGRLLVGDGEHGTVVSVGPGGDVRTIIPKAAGIRKPENIAVAPDGSVFIGDNDADRLYMVTPEGKLRVVIPATEGFSPEGLYHSGEALFITDRKNGKLYRYSVDEGLKPLIVFGGDLAKVQGIAGDGSGALYVTIQADISKGRGYVLRLTPTSKSAGRPS